MFKPWQAISFLIVFIVLVGGAFYWYYSMPNGASSADVNAQPVAQTTGDSSAATAPVNTAAASISASGSSDASFDADLSTVDTQLQSVNTDSAAVDQSFNDKPVAQTE